MVSRIAPQTSPVRAQSPSRRPITTAKPVPSAPQTTLARDIKPLQQGALDSLCGVYAIVNAFRLLCPELEIASALYLFRLLLSHKRKHRPKSLEFLRAGMTAPEQRILIKRARKFVKQEFNIGLKISKLSGIQQRDLKTVDQLMRLIAAKLQQNHVPIIGLEGRRSHWTIIRAISKSEIELFDSSKFAPLKRSNCRIKEEPSRDCILPHEITFIERVEF